MKMTSDSESDDKLCTLEEITETAKNDESNLLSTKSKDRYETTYLTFMKWKQENNITSFSEDVLLDYIRKLSEKTKPSTLWSQYSMLKSTLIDKHKINICNYSKLTTFLKEKSDGFTSKKSKVFTLNQIQKFLNEAPDDQHLATKVVLIFGITGACRGDELTKITVENIEHHGSLLLIKIPNTKTKVSRSYTIEGEFTKIVKKYEALRPKNAPTNRFFLNYQNGKCTTQVIGKNKIAKMPKKIANYLNLSEPELYTSHSFRRTSATLLADSGANKNTIKRHNGCTSTGVVLNQGYIENSINSKKKVDNLITSSINLNQSTPESEEPPRKQSKFEIKIDPSASTNFVTNEDNFQSQLIISNEKNNTILKFNNCNINITYTH